MVQTGRLRLRAKNHKGAINMYDLDYVDETIVEECKKAFSRIYPEYYPKVLGVCQDKQNVLIQSEFPDGTFYFRVDTRSVSAAYKSLEDADRV